MRLYKVVFNNSSSNQYNIESYSPYLLDIEQYLLNEIIHMGCIYINRGMYNTEIIMDISSKSSICYITQFYYSPVVYNLLEIGNYISVSERNKKIDELI